MILSAASASPRHPIPFPAISTADKLNSQQCLAVSLSISNRMVWSDEKGFGGAKQMRKRRFPPPAAENFSGAGGLQLQSILHHHQFDTRILTSRQRTFPPRKKSQQRRRRSLNNVAVPGCCEAIGTATAPAMRNPALHHGSCPRCGRSAAKLCSSAAQSARSRSQQRAPGIRSRPDQGGQDARRITKTESRHAHHGQHPV